MRDLSFMKCGCVAYAIDGKDGKPVCSIHNWCKEVVSPPDLTGRKAKCAYGGNIVDSDLNLPMFKHKPDKEYDEYYCGCFGWD